MQYPRSADNTLGSIRNPGGAGAGVIPIYVTGLLRKRIIRARVTLRGNPFLKGTVSRYKRGLAVIATIFRYVVYGEP